MSQTGTGGAGERYIVVSTDGHVGLGARAAPTHVRRYLGDVAIDVHNLGRAALRKVAERVGPTVAELSAAAVLPEGEAPGLYAFRTGPGTFV